MEVGSTKKIPFFLTLVENSPRSPGTEGYIRRDLEGHQQGAMVFFPGQEHPARSFLFFQETDPGC